MSGTKPARPIPVIVTRSEPGARYTCQRLAQQGYFALSSPALDLVRSPDVSLPDLSRHSGLVFTSANGVRFLTAETRARDLPCWCVGPATAEAARMAGFHTVYQSSGNALQLAEFILARGGRDGMPLAHIANAEAEGKLAARLALGHQSVTFVPLYQAQPAHDLAISVRKTLESELPAIVMIHSAKAALAFAYLARHLPHTELSSVVISRQAGEPLNRIGLTRICFADHPDEDGMFRALKKAHMALSA